MPDLIKTSLGVFTAPGTGFEIQGQAGSHQASVTVQGAAAVSASVTIRGSNDKLAWDVIGSASPSGTGAATASVSWTKDYLFWRADVTAMTGERVVVNVASDQAGGGAAVTAVGGGAITANSLKDALALKIEGAVRHQIDLTQQRVLVPPPAWVSGTTYYKPAVVRGTSAGNTDRWYMLIRKTGASTVEPGGASLPINAAYPRRYLKASDGCVWAPVDPQILPAAPWLGYQSLMNSAGTGVITPTVNETLNYQAPSTFDATLTQKHASYLDLSTSAAGGSASEPALSANRAALESIANIEGAVWDPVKAMKGMRFQYATDSSGAMTLPYINTSFQFVLTTVCSASKISIGIRGDDAANQTGKPIGNILIDGVYASYQGIPQDNVANNRMYWHTFAFKDAAPRLVTIMCPDIKFGGIYSNTANALSKPPADATRLRIAGAGDSTFAGAEFGPFSGTWMGWGEVVSRALGAGELLNFGQGSTGWLHPLIVTTPNRVNRTLPFYERVLYNPETFDTRAPYNAPQIDLMLVDMAGWDSDRGSSSTINSATRRARFSELLSTLTTWQPNMVYVFVTARRDISFSTAPATLDAAGLPIQNPTQTLTNAVTTEELVTDWRYAIQNTLSAEQYIIINRNQSPYAIKESTIHEYLPGAVILDDLVHPGLPQHLWFGKWVANEIRRQLNLPQ